MQFNPLEHQDLAIDHLTPRNEALLFAGMGLGKTASCLSALDWLFIDGDCKGILVVAPLRVAVLTWPDEVEKWDNFQYMRVANLRTKAGKKAWAEGKAHIYCINYEALPRFVAENIKGKRASELPVDSVLFDEIDNAKNPGSKRIRDFRKFARPKFRRAWGMTGTPVSSNYLDLFAQVRLIDQGKLFGLVFGKWRHQYFEFDNPFSQYPKYVLREGSKGKLEKEISNLALVLRSEDWLKIPPVKYVDVPVSIPKEAKRIYNKVEKELLETLDSGLEIMAPNAAALVTKLLQINSGAVYVQEGDDVSTRTVETIHTAKIDALKKLHKQHGNAPMLVACHYRHEIDRILEAIPGAELFQNDRLKAWNNREIPMLVAHPKSIGHGLNLQQGGNLLTWFSLGYNPRLYSQFNARLARQGQQHRTTVYRLMVHGSIDDAAASSLESKNNDESAFLKTLQNIKRLAEK